MEKILSISNFINGIQSTHLNWEYFLSIFYFCMNIKYVSGYFIVCCCGQKGLNIVVSAFLFPSYTYSAGIWI